MACALAGGGGDEPVATVAANTDDNAAQTDDNNDQENNSEATVAPAPTDEPQADPTDEPAPEPTDEPAPTAEVSGASPALDINAATSMLESVNSYRMEMSMSFEGTSEGEEVSGSMAGVFIVSNDPPASSISMNMTGFSDFGGEEVSINMAQIEDTSYVSMLGLGCFSGTADEMGDITGSFNEIANPEELFDGAQLENADYVGVQTQGGYESDCYQFDQDSAPPDADGDLIINDGLVCISKEFGHVSYIFMDGVGKNDIFSEGSDAEGTMMLELTISGINEPYEITKPEDCDEAGEGAYPTMADATEVSSFAGFYSYSSASSMDEVVAFYQLEMPAAGYTSTGEDTIFEGTLATLNYEKDGETVSITITPVDGSTQVLIITE
jgi:hypothetical protein